MKSTLTTLILLLISVLVYGQSSKDENEQQFCNEVKNYIVARDFKSIYPLLSTELQEDSLTIAKTCNRYGKYIDTHLLGYNDYFGKESQEDTHIRFGYRWASSENHTKCIIEITCEKKEEDYIITQLVFSSKIGQLPSRYFPEGSTCIFDSNLPTPPSEDH